MKTLSRPNRIQLIYTKKFCSDINFLTQNIMSDLPGEYKNQLQFSIERLVPHSEALDHKEKTILRSCRRRLSEIGETELSENFDKLL